MEDDRKLGDKMPLIEFLDLTDDDWRSLEDLPLDLLQRILGQFIAALQCGENKPEARVVAALEVAKQAQLIACKLFYEVTTPCSPDAIPPASFSFFKI